jgi:hypothetical protein
MRNPLRFFVVLATTSLGFGACASQPIPQSAHRVSQKIVHVVDPSGVPIQGAAVLLYVPSFNGDPTLSDANGNAPVDPSNFLGMENRMVVTKDGFDWVDLPVPSRWPLNVTLPKLPTTMPAM